MWAADEGFAPIALALLDARAEIDARNAANYTALMYATESGRVEVMNLLSFPDGRAILDLVSTIMVYKFGNFTRDEVNAMLAIELEQTRVYQDAKAEGKTEEGRSLVLRQLTRKLGREIDLDLQSRVNSLTIEQIESLGEALLDFQGIDELVNWLNDN